MAATTRPREKISLDAHTVDWVCTSGAVTIKSNQPHPYNHHQTTIAAKIFNNSKSNNNSNKILEILQLLQPLEILKLFELLEILKLFEILEILEY